MSTAHASLAAAPLACLFALAALMAVAAIGDWRRYIIPNWLCLTVALAGLVYWIAQWLAGVIDARDLAWTLAVQMGLAFAVLIVLAALFAAGAMGGGDVKLMAALSLWIPPARMPETLFFIALAGGLVSVMALMRARGQRLRARASGAAAVSHVRVPYGVAIAVGGLAVALEPILKVSAG